MFSTANIKEILQIFQPPKQESEVLPSLVLSSQGDTFITRKFLQAQFQEHVTNTQTRLSTATLASSLNISQTIIITLARSLPHLTLFSQDGQNLLPRSERDSVYQSLTESIHAGIVSRTDFGARNGVDQASLEALLNGIREDGVQVHEMNGVLYSEIYEEKLRGSLETLLVQSLEQTQSITLHDHDPQLPGSPPRWLTQHTLTGLITQPPFTDQFFIDHDADELSIQIFPKPLVHQTHVEAVKRILEGEVRYQLLQDFVAKFPQLYSNVDEVNSAFEKEGISVDSHYAISPFWLRELKEQTKERVEKDGYLDLEEFIGDQLPPDLRFHLIERLSHTLISSSDLTVRYSAPIIITNDLLKTINDAIPLIVSEDAAVQWKSLEQDHTYQIKLDPSKIRLSTHNPTFPDLSLAALLSEKDSMKEAERHFNAALAKHEGENEAAFAEFWTERVNMRLALNFIGLEAISEPKLSAQLAELLTTFALKEHIPDAITKARTKNLLLSRRTRRNIAKLEAVLKTCVAQGTTVIDNLINFARKQSLAIPDTWATKQGDAIATDSAPLDPGKESLVNDMQRRFAAAVIKPKKGDAPAMFLTLVVLLLAQHYPGVLHATGKFAPKLLKLLKDKVAESDYAALERWKESAKHGVLSAEDRAAMKIMAVGQEGFLEMSYA